MLTRVRAEQFIARHSVVDRLKTDVGMLPQLVPLEAREADTPGKARNGLGHIAGLQLSRGETRLKGGRLKDSLRSTRSSNKGARQNGSRQKKEAPYAVFP